MLCSRIVASRPPILAHNRNSVTEMTATGMDALTVRPTLRAKYSEEAPKIIPNNEPTITERAVNSRNRVTAGM